jgi:hypothetical protein
MITIRLGVAFAISMCAIACSHAAPDPSTGGDMRREAEAFMKAYGLAGCGKMVVEERFPDHRSNWVP